MPTDDFANRGRSRYVNEVILTSKVVDQAIDRDQTATFVKEIVLTRSQGPSGKRPDVPLAMVRKRCARRRDQTRGAILLIHGYGQNRYAWHLPSRSFCNYLAAQGYDVFNLDLRGHGRSRFLGARPPQHLAEYVREDVPVALKSVRKLSGHQRTFLMGHSLGGLISYAAAPSVQDHVAGVITLGSPYDFTRGSRFLAAIGDAMLTLDRKMSLGNMNVPLKSAGELMRLGRVFVESPLFPIPIRGYAPKSIENKVLGQHMSLAMDIGSVAVMRTLFMRAAEARRQGHRMGVLTEYAHDFEQLDVPLLVIAGSKDGLALPQAVRPAFERSNSADKTFRVFPQGHIDLLVGRNAPHTIWRVVGQWLDARAPSAAAPHSKAG